MAAQQCRSLGPAWSFPPKPHVVTYVTCMQVLVALPGMGEYTYEHVFMFSHWDEQARSKFVLITLASGAALAVTSDHYVWASKCDHCSAELITAGHVESSMHVWHVTPQGSRQELVSGTRIVSGRGLYNPHTDSGCIVVNGIAASTFTNILPPSLAAHRTVTLPFKVMYTLLHQMHLHEAVNCLLLILAPTFQQVLSAVQLGKI